jgi:hypothetical protein
MQRLNTKDTCIKVPFRDRPLESEQSVATRMSCRPMKAVLLTAGKAAG